MKIAFIVSKFPALSETFILSQITGLLDLGHEVDIYTLNRSRETLWHPDIERYRLLTHTHCIRDFCVPKTRWARIRWAVPVILRQVGRHPTLVWKWILKARREGAFGALKLLRIVEPFWSAEYAIIHCQFGPLGNELLFLKELSRAKYVCAFRGYDLSSYIAKEGSGVYQKLFRHGDLFLTVCDYFRTRLEQLGCDPRRIVVHRSGINVARFLPRSAEAHLGEQIKILTVARLVEKKGIEYAIRAVGLVVRKHPALRYVIAGSGPLEDSLQSLIHQLSLQHHVILVGPQNSEAVAGLISESDIYMLPSVTADNGDQEGIPGSLMEAQASGLPVLSTRHSGIPELVSDGESGWLVPERDVEALSDRLCFLIEHPEARRAFGACGRKIVEQTYDVKKLNKTLEEIYIRLLREPRVDRCAPAGEVMMPLGESDDVGKLNGAKEAPRRVDISVIIATRNRAESLRETLEAVSCQEIDKGLTYEVVVVDNGSTDGTGRFIEALKASFPAPLRYVHELRRGKSWALNRGITHAAGNLLAFTDDDVVPTRNWLQALWGCATEEQADAVSGKVLPRWDCVRPAWLTDDILRELNRLSIGCVDYGASRRSTAAGRNCRWVGGNVAIRREAIQCVGPFDVRMFPGEDSEYYERCVQRGLKVCYEPGALAHHKMGGERFTPSAFRRRRYQLGTSMAYLMPWDRRDLAILLPLWWYREVFATVWQWLKAVWARTSWWERFHHELALCQYMGVWHRRIQLWPRWWFTVLTGRSYLPPAPGLWSQAKEETR